MNYAIGIVAHYAREHLTDQLTKTVQPLYVSIDEGNIGPNTNHLLIWQNLAREQTMWSVALEDDANPIPNFRHNLGKVLRAAPAPIISLYLGKTRPPQWQHAIQDALDKADANNAHWIIAPQLLHHVGVAIRTNLIPDMLRNMKPYLPIDENIGQWARQHAHPIAYTVPSLVDHHDTPTLITHPDGVDREPGRVAWRIGTHDKWNSAAVEI